MGDEDQRQSQRVPPTPGKNGDLSTDGHHASFSSAPSRWACGKPPLAILHTVYPLSIDGTYALRRIGLTNTQSAVAACATIRLKLLKLGALITNSARRVKIAFTSACPWGDEWRLANAPRLRGLSRVSRGADSHGDTRGPPEGIVTSSK